MDPEEDRLRRGLGQQAVDGWGTAFVLGKRSRRSRVFRKSMSLTSIAVPLLIGGFAISFPSQFQETGWAIPAASLLLLAHTVISLVAVVFFSEDKLYITQESEVKNRNIAIRSDRLAKTAHLPLDAYKALAQEIINEYKALEEHDENRLGASQRERRIGCRSGLFRFGRVCGLCKQIPCSEKRHLYFRSKTCNRCGELLNGNTKSTTNSSWDKQAEPIRS